MSVTIDYQVGLLIFSILGLTFGLIGTIFACVAFINVKALEKSTHQVTYMPIDEAIDKENQKYMEETWATQEESIAKQKKLYKEDLQDVMPEFLTDDEDIKIHSF
jgi:hypothetical protein